MTRLVAVSSLLLLLAPSLFAAADREASRAELIIPVAGAAAGAHGTRFQTDVTLVSHSSSPNAPTLVDVYWLPRERPGTGAPVTRLVLEPRVVMFYEDFVARTLHLEGVGSLIFRAVNEDGSRNAAGHLDAYARIWTPVPGGTGTTSQGVHASTLYSPAVDDFQEIAGWIYGLRQDASFRTNYGIVNMGTKRLVFTVRFVTGSGTITEQVAVEAQSMTHRGVPAAATGALAISVTPHQEISIGNPTAPIQPWTAYGSSIDNITGDGWYSKAQAARPHND
ncbi:MAG TPA: hypothetical protein VGF28_13105 [Thermoanaerobaculia bacterium]|jgi:hypothetical protein